MSLVWPPRVLLLTTQLYFRESSFLEFSSRFYQKQVLRIRKYVVLIPGDVYIVINETSQYSHALSYTTTQAFKYSNGD